jgi:anti-sigma B factor antagonist
VSGPAPFSVVTDAADDRLVVSVHGELDLATAPQLEDVVLPVLKDGGDVVLDLRPLEFMDSTGVRVIVAAHVCAGEGGGSLVLVRTDPEGPVGRVLEISGLDGILEFVDGV